MLIIIQTNRLLYRNLHSEHRHIDSDYAIVYINPAFIISQNMKHCPSYKSNKTVTILSMYNTCPEPHCQTYNSFWLFMNWGIWSTLILLCWIHPFPLICYLYSLLLIRILVEEVKHRVHNTKAMNINSLFLLISMIFHLDCEFLSKWQINITFLYITHIRPT
jgi:hypothetical protein